MVFGKVVQAELREQQGGGGTGQLADEVDRSWLGIVRRELGETLSFGLDDCWEYKRNSGWKN